MNSISSIARSGLSAATFQMDAAAHNVANAQTPGFRRQQVVQQAQAGGGVQASVRTAEAPGGDMAADLGADLVQQKVALYSFKANLHVLKTEDEMLGSLLDLKA